jgi:hypothetical protein
VTLPAVIDVMRHLAEIERMKRDGAVERDRMYTRMRDEMQDGTTRAERARHHANSMLHTVSKFIPDACREDAYEELLLSFFWGDFEIVRVPPERDAQAAAELKRMATTIPEYFVLRDRRPIKP